MLGKHCEKCNTNFRFEHKQCPKCENSVWKFCEKCQAEFILCHIHCAKCDSSPQDHEVRNFDTLWRDGDVYCTKCETYVRRYDAS